MPSRKCFKAASVGLVVAEEGCSPWDESSTAQHRQTFGCLPQHVTVTYYIPPPDVSLRVSKKMETHWENTSALQELRALRILWHQLTSPSNRKKQ
ncbi:hypothetical protein RRG08_000086 [Elysia crispata]|uniref:Uncharacterized protein n=1 Tax=Elysia crispata TaxID=231223 RepID=A0AAE1A2V5_9GAST|nr:hypothetical protein RRG08_000086 [Elysia crispata]